MERFQEIILIVRHHHERWDGGDDPDRLNGRESNFFKNSAEAVDQILGMSES